MKEHPIYTDYCVVLDGRIWSKDRTTIRKDGTLLPIKGRWLKPGKHPSGHLHVVLRYNGKSITKKIHHLILETFVGFCPKNMEGCHNDGNPSNNRLGNLRWDTTSSNQLDRIKHGTDMRGTKHPNSKLTCKQVLDIRQDTRNNVEIAKEYKVSRENIRDIKLRKKWRWL